MPPSSVTSPQSRSRVASGSSVGVPLCAGVGQGTSAAEEEIASWVSRARHQSLSSVTALSAFQRRMERYPQLSADAQLELIEEFQLGARAAEELKELTSKTRKADRHRRELKQLVSRGRRAEEYLIGSNFRLLQLICREKAEERYGRDRAYDVLSDIVAEASIALVEAIRSYDVSKCPVFSTYAARVMRDRVSFTISKDGPIRLAPSWSRLKRIAAVRIPQLAAELERQPTEDEIRADLLKRCMAWAADKLTDEQNLLPEAEREVLMVAKLRKQGMLGAIESLSEVLQRSQSVASLDAAVGDEAGATLADLVVTPVDDATFDAAEMAQLSETLAEVLDGLPPRERRIVELRYGFVDGEHWTYNQIGAEFGVTAERIRQIEKSVLGRLGSSSNPISQRLAAFMPN
jgi:RNA polymerase primary sigma factor